MLFFSPGTAYLVYLDLSWVTQSHRDAVRWLMRVRAPALRGTPSRPSTSGGLFPLLTTSSERLSLLLGWRPEGVVSSLGLREALPQRTLRLS